MYDGPDGLIAGGDGGDESMKRLLLNQSVKTSKRETLNHQVSSIAGFAVHFLSFVVLSSGTIVKYCNIGMGGNCKMRKVGKPVSCKSRNMKLYFHTALFATLVLQVCNFPNVQAYPQINV